MGDPSCCRPSEKRSSNRPSPSAREQGIRAVEPRPASRSIATTVRFQSASSRLDIQSTISSEFDVGRETQHRKNAIIAQLRCSAPRRRPASSRCSREWQTLPAELPHVCVRADPGPRARPSWLAPVATSRLPLPLLPMCTTGAVHVRKRGSPARSRPELRSGEPAHPAASGCNARECRDDWVAFTSQEVPHFAGSRVDDRFSGVGVIGRESGLDRSST